MPPPPGIAPPAPPAKATQASSEAARAEVTRDELAPRPSTAAPIDEAAFYACADLPTRHGTFTLRVFREASTGKEHLALSVGAVAGVAGLPVRVHSECLTSEVFGSLKCDCRDQLEAALASIQAAGQGVVLYLRQEGRGIGLGNKIRAYQLQAEGADTVDANRLLGFADDLRSYAVAAEMLAALSVHSVRVITNNPSKIEGLTAHGVEVVGRLPLVAGANATNQGYLETKRQRMGHLFGSPESEDP